MLVNSFRLSGTLVELSPVCFPLAVTGTRVMVAFSWVFSFVPQVNVNVQLVVVRSFGESAVSATAAG